MRVIKPTEISVQLRPFQFEGQHQLAIGILMAYPFDATEAPYSEQDLWTLASEHLNQWDAFDEGMPKAFAEYLVYGNYYAAEPVSADEVQVQVGSLSKTLTVTGQREWRKLTGSTEPKALTELPLSYEYAYGGEGFDKNPVGMGRDGVWIPQIEHPDARFSHPNTEIIPAGFTARNIDWLPRKQWWGTYNERWQQQDAPGFARDIQWQIFQLAPEDQWLKTPNWTGEESFRVRNMHPEYTVQEGKLPNVRIRCFALKGGELYDISAKYETVWLYPNVSAQIAGYRAQIPLETFDGQEIEALMVAYESAQSAKKPLEHYAAAIEKRLLPEGDEDDPTDLALRADDRALSELNPEPESTKTEPELPGAGAAMGLGALAVLAKMKGGKGGADESAAAQAGEAQVDDASAAELDAATTDTEQGGAQESAAADAPAPAAESTSEEPSEAQKVMAELDAMLDKMQDKLNVASQLSAEAAANMGIDTSALSDVASEADITAMIDQAIPASGPSASKILDEGALEEALKEPEALAKQVAADMSSSSALGDASSVIDQLTGDGIEDLAADAIIKQENLTALKNMPKASDVESAMDPELLDAIRKTTDPDA